MRYLKLFEGFEDAKNDPYYFRKKRNKNICSTCNGTGEIECYNCEGTGCVDQCTNICDTCHADGVLICHTCKGLGKIKPKEVPAVIKKDAPLVKKEAKKEIDKRVDPHYFSRNMMSVNRVCEYCNRPFDSLIHITPGKISRRMEIGEKDK